MKVTSHGQYLWKLTRWWVINMYLVQEEDGVTLIDTGMSGSGAEIVAAAGGIGQPIRRVVLTHAHMDHAASLDELRALLPEAEFILGTRTAAFLAGEPGAARSAARNSRELHQTPRETRKHGYGFQGC